MRKTTFLLTMIFVFALASSTAFAGPFANVSKDDWTYSAINKLSQNGLIDGMEGVNFGSDKKLSRFEMAMLVGKAMENKEKASVEDKNIIDKLSLEFSKELSIFGVDVQSVGNEVVVKSLDDNDNNNVKVDELEKKVEKLEKLKISGDFYLRYLGEINRVDNSRSDGSYFRSRIRLNLDYKVDEKSSAFIRFSSRNLFGTSGRSRSAWETNTEPNYQQLDQYYIKYVDKGFTYKVGRQSAWLGQGLLISTGDDAQWPNQFDGVTISGKLGNVNTNLIIGETTKSKPLEGYGDTRATWVGFDASTQITDNWRIGGAFAYHKFNKERLLAAGNPMGLPQKMNIWALNTSYQVAPNFTLSAEYAKSNANSDNSAYFIAGTLKLNKTNSLTLTYINTERYAIDPYNSIYGALIPLNFGAGIAIDPDTYAPLSRNYKAWQAYYYHQLSKNTSLDVYLINAKAKGFSGSDFEYYLGWNYYF